MKKINNLIGHNYLFQNLIELYQKNVLPNRILLNGNKGIGKFLFSTHFVNHILSQNEEYKYDLKNLEINNYNRSYLLYKNNTHPNIFILNKKDFFFSRLKMNFAGCPEYPSHRPGSGHRSPRPTRIHQHQDFASKIFLYSLYIFIEFSTLYCLTTGLQ